MFGLKDKAIAKHEKTTKNESMSNENHTYFGLLPCHVL